MISQFDCPKFFKPSGKKKLKELTSWIKQGHLFSRIDFVKSDTYDEFQRELEIHRTMGEFVPSEEDKDSESGWRALTYSEGITYYNLASIIVGLRGTINRLESEIDDVNRNLRHHNLQDSDYDRYY